MSESMDIEALRPNYDALNDYMSRLNDSFMELEEAGTQENGTNATNLINYLAEYLDSLMTQIQSLASKCTLVDTKMQELKRQEESLKQSQNQANAQMHGLRLLEEALKQSQDQANAAKDQAQKKEADLIQCIKNVAIGPDIVKRFDEMSRTFAEDNTSRKEDVERAISAAKVTAETQVNLDQARMRVAALEINLAQFRTSSTQIAQQTKQEHQSVLSEKDMQLSQASVENKSLRDQLNQHQSILSEKDIQLSQASAENTSLREQLKRNVDKLDEAEKRIGGFERQRQIEISTIEERMRVFTGEHEKYKSNLMKANRKIGHLEKELGGVKQMTEDLQAHNSSLVAAAAELRSSLEKMHAMELQVQDKLTSKLPTEKEDRSSFSISGVSAASRSLKTARVAGVEELPTSPNKRQCINVGPVPSKADQGWRKYIFDLYTIAENVIPEEIEDLPTIFYELCRCFTSDQSIEAFGKMKTLGLTGWFCFASVLADTTMEHREALEWEEIDNDNGICTCCADTQDIHFPNCLQGKFGDKGLVLRLWVINTMYIDE